MIVGWIHLAIAAAAFAVGAGYTYFYPGAKQDNPIEEAAEQVIKNQTGLDIDITPQTPETEAKKEELDFKLTDDIK